jgi:hypothetical protein
VVQLRFCTAGLEKVLSSAAYHSAHARLKQDARLPRLRSHRLKVPRLFIPWMGPSGKRKRYHPCRMGRSAGGNRGTTSPICFICRQLVVESGPDWPGPSSHVQRYPMRRHGGERRVLHRCKAETNPTRVNERHHPDSQCLRIAYHPPRNELSAVGSAHAIYSRERAMPIPRT